MPLFWAFKRRSSCTSCLLPFSSTLSTQHAWGKKKGEQILAIVCLAHQGRRCLDISRDGRAFLTLEARQSVIETNLISMTNSSVKRVVVVVVHYANFLLPPTADEFLFICFPLPRLIDAHLLFGKCKIHISRVPAKFERDELYAPVAKLGLTTGFAGRLSSSAAAAAGSSLDCIDSIYYFGLLLDV